MQETRLTKVFSLFYTVECPQITTHKSGFQTFLPITENVVVKGSGTDNYWRIKKTNERRKPWWFLEVKLSSVTRILSAFRGLRCSNITFDIC